MISQNDKNDAEYGELVKAKDRNVKYNYEKDMHKVNKYRRTIS
jgi:hypothetical protein